MDLKKKHSIPADHLVVGYIGGIGPEAALTELIEALALSKKTTVILWGWSDKAYEAKLKDLIQARGVESQVVWGGQLGRTQKWSSLKGCDVLYCVYSGSVLRLRYAATASNKFAESLACGVPVITAEAGGFKELVERLGVGISTPDLSPSTLAQALEKLHNPFVRKKMAEQGKRAYETEFNYETQFLPVVENFIEARKVALQKRAA